MWKVVEECNLGLIKLGAGSPDIIEVVGSILEFLDSILIGLNLLHGASL